MELSRRDAIAALAAAGIGLGGAAAYASDSVPDPGSPADAASNGEPSPGASGSDELLATLVSLAEVLYPSAVSGTGEFVETYATGRFEDDGARRERVSEAAATLDARANKQYGADFRTLSADERDDVLREMNQSYTDADPDGDELQRVRYYLVDELLYALFSSPKGGRLAGSENPAGYPGGLEAYQQGPQT